MQRITPAGWETMTRVLSTTTLLCLALYTPALPQNPALADAARLVEAERYAEAKPVLLQITAREPDNAAAAYWAGRALVQLGEDEAGAKQLERAVQLQPNSSEYQLWLGRAYGSQAQRAGTLRQPGLARRTKAVFERAVALDANNLDARSHLIDFHLAAPGVMGGNKQTALQQAREIQQRNAYRGLLEIARVQLALEQEQAAVQTMHDLIRTYPDSTTPRVNLALYYQNVKRFDYAYQTLQPLTSRTPPNRPGLYQLGRLAAISGHYLPEGEAALRAYLAGTPQRGEQPPIAAHWRLGMILQQRGDVAGARREYEAALRIDPKYQPAADALKKLK